MPPQEVIVGVQPQVLAVAPPPHVSYSLAQGQTLGTPQVVKRHWPPRATPPEGHVGWVQQMPLVGLQTCGLVHAQSRVPPQPFDRLSRRQSLLHVLGVHTHLSPSQRILA